MDLSVQSSSSNTPPTPQQRLLDAFRAYVYALPVEWQTDSVLTRLDLHLAMSRNSQTILSSTRDLLKLNDADAEAAIQWLATTRLSRP